MVQNERVTVTTKTAAKSRTIWVNGAVILAALVAIGGDALNLTTTLGIDLPEGAGKYIALALGVANIILRRLTFQPLTGTVPYGR